MKIITGYTGTKHITPADDAGLHRSTFGSGDYVLASGSQLAAQAESATEIRIADGELVMQGRHARNETGYEPVPIANGTQGMYRNDLIVARYAIDASTSVESISLVAITGTAATGTAADPSYNIGDIDSGETRDFPLYRVRLNGVNIEGIDQLFNVAKSSKELEADIDDLNEALESTEKSLTTKINGKAASSHNHAASAINSGTLSTDRLPTIPVTKGGTGAKSVAGARNALGLGNTSGALPVANGGTGATSASAARTNLGVLGNSGLQILNQGTLRILDENSTGQGFAVRRKHDDGYKSLALQVYEDSAYLRSVSMDADGNNQEVTNYILLKSDETKLGKPLAVQSGGTGATTVNAALENLGFSSGTLGVTAEPVIRDASGERYGTPEISYNKSIYKTSAYSPMDVFLNIRVKFDASLATIVADKYYSVAHIGYEPPIATALSAISTLDNARQFDAYIDTSGVIWIKPTTDLEKGKYVTLSVTGVFARV